MVGCPSSGFLGLSEEVALLPKAIEDTVHDGAANRQNVVCAAEGPEHSGLFEALADDGFASGLNDTRANEQTGVAR
jgi:hypothetical protein